MYKTRLKTWNITKYNLEAIMAALVRNIENRKRGGKRSLIYKNGVPFSRDKITSHLKKKGMTADQLLRKVPSNAPMPAGFDCVTPPPEQAEDTPSSNSNPFTPPDQFSTTDTPPTSGRDSGCSSSGSFATPQLIPNQSQDDSQAPALLSSPEAAPLPDAYPWPMADFLVDIEPDLMQITGQSFENPTAEQFTHSSIVDISGQVLSFSSPNSCQPSNELDVNFHMSMSTCTQDTDCYQFLRCRQGGESQRSPRAPSDLQPDTFTSFCFLACILHSQGQEQSANSVASNAFEIYQMLIKQEHKHALACLNHVLAVLIMHGQSLFAVDVLKHAQQAALCHLHPEDPVIVTINFMVQQASSTVKQCGITPARLREVYDDFRNSRALNHPYTLLAGYNLAWRLAIDGHGDGLEHAHNLLSELQRPAEDTFGTVHMQTIAILTTKARVLHDLKYRKTAEKLMSEAILRIESVYHGKHPYALEAKRRHSILLDAVNQTSAAEKRLVDVALGRVEVLGREHKFSKESVEDVKRFLCTPGRDAELEAFIADLNEATVRSGSRNLTTETVKFW
jgi:hypothetical protein